MTTNIDIDKKVAELESMQVGLDQRLEETSKKGRRSVPSWLKIIGVAAVIDVAARLFLPSSMPFVLVLEALIFSGAAVALTLPVIRKARMTGFRKKLHILLGAAFALGAIRSGMWGLGIPVEYANLTIFLLGLAGLAVVYFWKKKGGSDSVSDF